MATNENFVFIGDSVISSVYGDGVCDARKHFTHQITEAKPVNTTFFGSAGQRLTTFPYPYQYKTLTQSYKALEFMHGPFSTIRLVCVMIGHNDWVGGARIEIFREKYFQMMEFFQEIGIEHIYAVSMITSEQADEETANVAGHYLQDYRDTIQSVAEELGVEFIDGTTLLIEGEGDPGFRYGGVHLNADGHVRFAEELLARFESDGVVFDSYS